tara:strand:+ start:926 stop:1840 length:915 start_codon:yes stop_codon:yes gene_type:complete
MNFITKFPLGQYVDGNNSWLKLIDGRLKLLILIIFLITPIWAGPIWRISLVFNLILITFLSFLPLRVWWRSLIFLLVLSLFIGTLSILATSNISNIETSFRDPSELNIILNNKLSWNIFELKSTKFGFFTFGPFNLSTRALDLGIKTSTLIFTVIQSVNLLLLTTLKEEIVWSLSWFLNPLRILGLPIDKWLFQLLLSLRFIPLVQEEFQNIIKSISIRSINFRHLGIKKSVNILLCLVERLFLNILLRIDQGADSLLSKGTLEINTQRFKVVQKFNVSRFIANLLSTIFIFVAIFLRKMYGSL